MGPDRIITVGIAPAWDVRCFGEGLEWGRHATLTAQSTVPAGKALNVSRALAWLGRPSVAAGLWGADDYTEMTRATAAWRDHVDVRLTAAAGRTRHNVTVLDRKQNREMHLRAENELATKQNLQCLQQDLTALVDDRYVCVFAGAMPVDDRLSACLACVDLCRQAGARLVIDTCGPALHGGTS